MPQPKHHDPYRTPPLWIEPEEPLDYDHSRSSKGDDNEGHDGNDDGFNGRPESPIGEFAEPLSDFSQGKSSMKFLDFLIPPINAHPEHLRRWRLAVSLALIALYVTVPIMFGLIPAIPPVLASVAEISGLKNEIKEIKNDMKEDRIDRLDQQIDDLRKDHCLADTQKSKTYYNDKLKKLERKFKELDQTYQRTLCKDLGVPDVQVTTP